MTYDDPGVARSPAVMMPAEIAVLAASLRYTLHSIAVREDARAALDIVKRLDAACEQSRARLELVPNQKRGR